MEKILATALVVLFGVTSAQAVDRASELHIPLNVSKVSLDPRGVQDTFSLLVARQLHCQLVRMKGWETIPEAAQQVRYVTPTLLRITLRDDARFVDESPVTATDVVATFELLRSSRLVLRNVFAWIKDVKAVDGRTVEFELRKPIPSFLKFLAAPNYALMPESFIRRARQHPELWDTPIGCGHYKVSTEDHKDYEVRLVPVAKGRPLVFHLAGNRTTSRDELSHYDILDSPFSDTMPSLIGFREEKLFEPRQIYLGLDTRLPEWENRKARCELFSHVGRDAIVQGYGAMAETPTSFFPRGVLGYAKEPMRARADTAPISFHRPFRLAFLELSVPEYRRALFVNALKGVSAQIETTLIKDPKHFGEDFLKSHADAMVVALKSNYLDGYEFLLIFAEPTADITGFDDAGLRRRISDSQQIEDPSVRARSYQEIASEISSQCLVLPLVALPERRILVREGLSMPGFGEVSINEYDLGLIH